MTRVTDENGTTTARYSYSTYGRRTTIEGSGSEVFGYCGRDGVLTETNGLLYMRARYYSPELMRFINQDIVVGDISNSTSLSRYSYVNGNPVTNIDPFGLEAEWSGGKNSIAIGEEVAYQSKAIRDARLEAQALKASASAKYAMAMLLQDKANKLWKNAAIWGGASALGLLASEVAVVPGVGEVYLYSEGSAIIGFAGYTSSAALTEIVVGCNILSARITYSKANKLEEQASQEEKKKTPNPNGKKGGEAHRNGINSIKSENGEIRYEQRFETPGGQKQNRFADAVEVVEDKIITIFQVGKVNKNGTPVSRELKAIMDLMLSPKYSGQPIHFIPYNNPDIPYIVFGIK